MSSMKDKVADAAHAVGDAAKTVGHKVAEGATQAAEFVKEKTGLGTHADVKPHMAVVASCGTTVGKVDHVEGKTIKLTRNDSPDGMHHFIPAAWVSRVDEKVHLSKNSEETKQGWKADAASCGC